MPCNAPWWVEESKVIPLPPGGGHTLQGEAGRRRPNSTLPPGGGHILQGEAGSSRPNSTLPPGGAHILQGEAGKSRPDSTLPPGGGNTLQGETGRRRPNSTLPPDGGHSRKERQIEANLAVHCPLVDGYQTVDLVTTFTCAIQQYEGNLHAGA